MYDVQIADCQTCLEIDEPWLREIVEKTLAAEGVAAASISLALVDDPQIQELNRRYLGHDCLTDVLSFLLECEPADDAGFSGERTSTVRGRGKRIEGEVIVSTQTTLAAAHHFARTPHAELALYIVHGILHLLGYDDETDIERHLMRQREREILSIWDSYSPPS